MKNNGNAFDVPQCDDDFVFQQSARGAVENLSKKEFNRRDRKERRVNDWNRDKKQNVSFSATSASSAVELFNRASSGLFLSEKAA